MSLFPIELPSSTEMSAAEAALLSSDKSLSVLILMERAGEAVAKRAEIVAREQAGYSKSSPIVVLCGPGNNGGDGLVVARLLASRGLVVAVVICSEKELSPTCLTQLKESQRANNRNLSFLRMAGSNVASLSDISAEGLEKLTSSASLIIDALLGTGQNRPPAGLVADTLAILKKAKGAVLALDVPTGINPDTGAVYLNAVNASHTVCIERIKRGLAQPPARERCGELICETIGIPVSGTEFSILNLESFKRPSNRPQDSHKGMFGPILALAGSGTMPGAACLVGLAALRAGGGVVHTTSAKAVEFAPELIEANFSTSDLSDFKSIVIGPGLGTDDAMSRLLEHVLGLRKRVPIVVDADALTIVAANKAFELLADTIITPHPGEAARLLGTTTAEIQNDRYSAVRELASRTKATVILKGASTIVYSSNDGVGRGLVNTTGTPWMSTAGSGDVLAGIVSALTLQGLSRFEASVASVALHGLCGQIASHVDHPIIATDLIAAIPSAWDQLFVKRI